MRHAIAIFLLATAAAVASPALAVTYEVGPGEAYANIGDVPWESLAAGDVVRIHWRSDAYNEKFVICAEGTESEPILVQGVPGPGGELPVIDGRDATTRPELDYWNEERSVLKIGGASTPSCTVPAWIVVEDLEIRSARPAYDFTNDGGSGSTYASNAASVHIENGEHIVLRRLRLHDSGNGLFAGGEVSDVLVTSCRLWDNGIEGSAYEHNSYTEAHGIVFQYNWYGPLRTGCDGNNLKDRSAGTVVRYNWIESGNRQLDLVDSGDLSSLPEYATTFVYGNVLVEHDGDGNSQIVHYGGDGSDTSAYRGGTLHFYNNTVVSTRGGNTTLLRLSTGDESADVRNNIIYVTEDGSRLAMSNADGVIDLMNNWTKPGWRDSHSGLAGEVNDLGGNVTGSSPGFEDEGAGDYHLVATADGIDAGTDLAGATLPEHALLQQYVVHQATEPRPVENALDIGAFETCVSGDCTGAGDEVVDAPPDLPPDGTTDAVTDGWDDVAPDVPPDTAGDPTVDSVTDTIGDPGGDADDDGTGGDGGCGCTLAGDAPAPPLLALAALLVLLAARRRR